MFLVQTIYCSEVSIALNEQNIQQILDSSKRNNSPLGISGLLLFNGRFFMQVLEGKRSDVAKRLNIIAQDSRHQNMTLLSHREIFERDFSLWSMAYVGQTKMLKESILRYSTTNEFAPETLTGSGALALLKEFAKLA